MTVLIDGSAVESREALHDTLARQLSLPEYYGRNLDALYDCLTDVREDTELCLVRFPALCEHLGLYANVLRDVLEDACGENPHLRLISED